MTAAGLRQLCISAYIKLREAETIHSPGANRMIQPFKAPLEKARRMVGHGNTLK
jgi:hypothetical protein